MEHGPFIDDVWWISIIYLLKIAIFHSYVKLPEGIYIYGYRSIPIDTFLVGWTSIYQLFWGSPGVQGFDTLPYGDGSKPVILGVINIHSPSISGYLEHQGLDPRPIWPLIWRHWLIKWMGHIQHRDHFGSISMYMYISITMVFISITGKHDVYS